MARLGSVVERARKSVQGEKPVNLDNLFQENTAPEDKQPQGTLGFEGSPGDMPAMLDVEQIDDNPQNSRILFKEAELDRLAESMKQEDIGMLQPIGVRPAIAGKTDVRKDRFIVIYGSRRFQAAKRAGFTQIPVIIKTKLAGEAGIIKASMINLIENLQREDLSAIEKAEGMVKLKDRMQEHLEIWIGLNHPMKDLAGYDRLNPEKLSPNGYKELADKHPNLLPWMRAALLRTATHQKRPFVTWEDVATETNIDVQTLKRYSQIAKLPPEIKNDAIEHNTNYATLMELTKIPDPTTQRQASRQVVRKGLNSVQVAEKFKGGRSSIATVTAPAPTAREVYLSDLRRMTSRLAQLREGSGKFSESFKREVRKEAELLLANLDG